MSLPDPYVLFDGAPSWLRLLIVLILAHLSYKTWLAVNRFNREWRVASRILDERRKAGIPDEDKRPFKIAKAAVETKRSSSIENHVYKPKVAFTTQSISLGARESGTSDAPDVSPKVAARRLSTKAQASRVASGADRGLIRRSDTHGSPDSVVAHTEAQSKKIHIPLRSKHKRSASSFAPLDASPSASPDARDRARTMKKVKTKSAIHSPNKRALKLPTELNRKKTRLSVPGDLSLPNEASGEWLDGPDNESEPIGNDKGKKRLFSDAASDADLSIRDTHHKRGKSANSPNEDEMNHEESEKHSNQIELDQDVFMVTHEGETKKLIKIKQPSQAVDFAEELLPDEDTIERRWVTRTEFDRLKKTGKLMIPGEVWDDRSTTSSDSMNMSIDVEVIDTIASPKPRAGPEIEHGPIWSIEGKPSSRSLSNEITSSTKSRNAGSRPKNSLGRIRLSLPPDPPSPAPRSRSNLGPLQQNKRYIDEKTLHRDQQTNDLHSVQSNHHHPDGHQPATVSRAPLSLPPTVNMAKVPTSFDNKDSHPNLNATGQLGSTSQILHSDSSSAAAPALITSSPFGMAFSPSKPKLATNPSQADVLKLSSPVSTVSLAGLAQNTASIQGKAAQSPIALKPSLSTVSGGFPSTTASSSPFSFGQSASPAVGSAVFSTNPLNSSAQGTHVPSTTIFGGFKSDAKVASDTPPLATPTNNPTPISTSTSTPAFQFADAPLRNAAPASPKSSLLSTATSSTPSFSFGSFASPSTQKNQSSSQQTNLFSSLAPSKASEVATQPTVSHLSSASLTHPTATPTATFGGVSSGSGAPASFSIPTPVNFTINNSPTTFGSQVNQTATHSSHVKQVTPVHSIPSNGLPNSVPNIDPPSPAPGSTSLPMKPADEQSTLSTTASASAVSVPNFMSSATSTPNPTKLHQPIEHGQSGGSPVVTSRPLAGPESPSARRVAKLRTGRPGAGPNRVLANAISGVGKQSAAPIVRPADGDLSGIKLPSGITSGGPSFPSVSPNTLARESKSSSFTTGSSVAAQSSETVFSFGTPLITPSFATPKSEPFGVPNSHAASSITPETPSSLFGLTSTQGIGFTLANSLSTKPSFPTFNSTADQGSSKTGSASVFGNSGTSSFNFPSTSDDKQGTAPATTGSPSNSVPAFSFTVQSPKEK